MYIKGDFHLHTTASDGKLSPEELIRYAKEKDISVIAVTDHDTTEGIGRALSEGQKQGIRVIPGIELSTIHNGESVHMLGYFRDDSYHNEYFQKFLYDMKNYRVTRARKIMENLEKYFDIKLDYEKVYETAKGVIARPHIAKAIIEAGYDYTWDYIFDHLIGKDSPAYVPNKKVSVPEGIELLKSVNALVVLAHPILLKRTKAEELMSFDFDGVEAVYVLNTDEQTKELSSMAKAYNKFITSGSDFHGHNPGDTKHGDMGCVCLDTSLTEEFLMRIGLNT